MQANVHNRHGFGEQNGSHACIQIHINMFLHVLFKKHFPKSLSISQIMFPKSFRVFPFQWLFHNLFNNPVSFIFQSLVFSLNYIVGPIHVHTPVTPDRLKQTCCQWYIFLYLFPYALPNQSGLHCFWDKGEEHHPHAKHGWENALWILKQKRTWEQMVACLEWHNGLWLRC